MPDAAERLLRGLWAGTLCAVGYLAAPVLFSVLDDRALAGRLAGEMFTAATWASLAMAGLLAAAWAGRAGTRLRYALAAAAVLLLAGNEWLLRPVMEAARLPDGRPGPGFGPLHGVSSLLWLAASAASLWLAALREPRRRAG